MKVKKLKQLLDKIPDDLEIRIRTANPSIGPIASVGIDQVYQGIDWDQGNFIILPDKKVKYETA